MGTIDLIHVTSSAFGSTSNAADTAFHETTHLFGFQHATMGYWDSHPRLMMHSHNASAKCATPRYGDFINMRIRMISRTFAAVLLLALSSSVVAAQGTGDAMQVEVAAARAMLGTRSTTGPVAVDPRHGRSGAAPSFITASSVGARVYAAALAHAIGSSLRTYEEVTKCKGVCPLVGVTAHLTLSAPAFSGGTATITVTLLENSLDGTMGPVDYESVQFTLSRGANGWVVTNRQQLGVS